MGLLRQLAERGFAWATHPATALLILIVLGFSWALKRAMEVYYSQPARYRVLHISSEINDREEIPARRTIEKVIGESLRGKMSAERRRRKVVALLKAGGLQMYNQETNEPIGNPEDYVRDGLTYGQLSGGQKHLVYVLRCIAADPEVMLCDEVLGGLDAYRQPRVLHMLRRMLRERHVALLYITCELHQLRLIGDSIAFMADECIYEYGSNQQLLDQPKHPLTKEYVSGYRGLPGCSDIGGRLAQAFAEIKNDPDLLGDWLP